MNQDLLTHLREITAEERALLETLTLAKVSVPCLHSLHRTLSFPGFTAWQKFLQKT